MHVAHYIAAVIRRARRGSERAFLQRAPVHEADRHPSISHNGIHFGICETAGDIVNHVHPGRGRSGGNRGAHRIHRGANALLVQCLDDRDHAVGFFLCFHAHRARAGGFAAHIDHVRTLFHQLAGMIGGGVKVEPPPAIGKGILCNIHDAHDERALRDGQLCN